MHIIRSLLSFVIFCGYRLVKVDHTIHIYSAAPVAFFLTWINFNPSMENFYYIHYNDYFMGFAALSFICAILFHGEHADQP